MIDRFLQWIYRLCGGKICKPMEHIWDSMLVDGGMKKMWYCTACGWAKK